MMNASVFLVLAVHELAAAAELAVAAGAAEKSDTHSPTDRPASDTFAKRIDPADLYAITIRPVPGNPPRVEIILPTGGKHQEDAEQRNWDGILAEAAKDHSGLRYHPTVGRVGSDRATFANRLGTLAGS